MVGLEVDPQQEGMPMRGDKVRVLIIQPVVPKYRIGIFRRLSRVEGLDIKVLASRGPLTADSIKEADFSEFSYGECRTASFAGGRVLVQYKFTPGAWLRESDVLVVSGNLRYLNLLPLILFARVRRIGVVWWGHGWSVGSRGRRAAIRRKLMNLANAILVYTDKEAQELIDEGGLADRIFATNNTIDDSEVRAAIRGWSASDLVDFRTRYGLQDREVILFCGRLKARAELPVLLSAMQNVLRTQPEAMLVVIGDGPERLGLERLAKELGIDHAILWAGAVYEESVLAGWFQSASVFAFPGSIGLSLIHALSYSLPVVAHDDAVSHAPEFAALVQGVNGLTFKRGNHESLAESITKILADTHRRDAMAAAAGLTVADKYSADSMVARIESAILYARKNARPRQG